MAQTWDYGGSLQASDGSIAPISFRERSAEAGVRYGWRRWRVGVDWRLGGFIERDELTNDGSAPLTFVPRNPTFVGMVLSANVTRVEIPALAISRENGGSLTGLYLRRWQLGGSNWSYEMRGGANGYVITSYSIHYTKLYDHGQLLETTEMMAALVVIVALGVGLTYALTVLENRFDSWRVGPGY